MIRWIACVSLAVLVPLGSPGTTQAQSLLENHFKAYHVSDPRVNPERVTLEDQWGRTTHDNPRVEYFATPVQKVHDGRTTDIINGALHHTWWAISGTEPTREFLVSNQFGEAMWRSARARYLLLPALKDDPQVAIPETNHYKCYEALGPVPDDVTVTLTDQFGQTTVAIGRPVVFCNPTSKSTSTHESPIVDETVHLACYEFTPLERVGHRVQATDQFGDRSLQLDEEFVLCVPSFKEMATVPVDETTWGQVKTLYRE